MEYNPVAIKSLLSPNYTTQRRYLVSCEDHRVVATVTATPSVVRTWVLKIRHFYHHYLLARRLVVGLGVQWNSRYRDEPATLQLCVGHHCLIFQLLHADSCPSALRRFLGDDEINFVGIWNHHDARMLEESRHGIRVKNLVDVRRAASDLRGCEKRISLERLATEVLGIDGVRKEPEVGRSDWDAERLSEVQVQYACLDAFICFLLGKTIRIWDWDPMDD